MALNIYLFAFLENWNHELQPDGKFRWQVIRANANAPLLGIVFSTQYKNTPPPPPKDSDAEEWATRYAQAETLLLEYTDQMKAIAPNPSKRELQHITETSSRLATLYKDRQESDTAFPVLIKRASR